MNSVGTLTSKMVRKLSLFFTTLTLLLHSRFTFALNVGTLFGITPESLKPPQDLLKDTYLGRDDVELTRCYKATKDGFSAINFHRCVDGKGSAIVVALSRSGAVFGGFNPGGWRSSDDYSASSNAWLWFEHRGKNVKVPILQGGNAAIFDYATGGPCFGSSDLVIGGPKAAVMGGFAGPDMDDVSINAGDLRECNSNLGSAYEYVNGWPCRGRIRILEVEVYVNTAIDKLGGRKSWWSF